MINIKRGPINFIHGDCMEYLKELEPGAFDLAIIDPPYGLGESGMKKRNRPAKQKNGSKLRVKEKNYIPKDWDKEPPDEEFFKLLFKVSKNNIIFGANHFISRLPVQDSPAWFVWDKVNGKSDFSDCELARTTFSSAVRKFTFMWAGMMQGNPSDGSKMQGNKKLNEKRIHPTQKPVQLYKFLLQTYAKPGQTILDTHGGSGSLAIACYELGFPLVIIEKDKDYFDAMVSRFKKHTQQLKLELD